MIRFRWIAVIVAAAAASGMVVAGGASGASKLSPPVIHEKFTLLPCSGKPSNRTTLQMEGCAEHQIVKTDATINALSKSIFQVLSTNSARRDFISAQRTWLGFRRADCLSESDLFQGGTQAAVVDAQCTADRNVQRIKELRTFRSDLGHGG